MRIPITALGVLVSLFLVPACGGGGGGGGGSVATADILIGDAPVDDLLSFSAIVQSVRLQRDDLTFTGNLVGSLEIEFLGLNGALAFLAKGRIAPGTYVSAEIGFVPGSYVAKADDGSPVAIVPASNTYVAPLPGPLVVAAGDYVRFTVDLDLLSSLSGAVANGTLDFDPSGSCDSNDGSEDAPIDELRGSVRSSDAVAHTIVVDASVGDPPAHIGQVTVLVTGGTVLLDNDNAPLTLSAFFAALATGTILEVHGDLGADGAVTATRIELEDAGGGGGAAVARIRGIVAALAPPQLSLRITQIKDGVRAVAPVLAGLEDPDVIEVGFGEGTAFLFDDGGLTSSASLAVGQEITARFSAFVAPPFPASEIEIDDSPGFHATLTGHDRDGALLLRLDARDPAVRTGSGATGEVSLALGLAPIVLDVPGSPALAAGELLPGLELEVHGRLGGPPAAPVLSAERVLVHPGTLRGASLADVAPGGANFVVAGGALVDPFGLGVTPGPLLMWIEDGCTFEGDARSLAEFEALAGGRQATLDVRGVGNGVANEVRAFAVRVRME